MSETDIQVLPYLMDPTYDMVNASKPVSVLSIIATHNQHTETRLLELMKERVQSEHSGLQLAKIKEASEKAVLTCFTHHLCAGSTVVVHFPTDVQRGAKTVASDQRGWFRWDRRSSRSDARHNMPKRYATLHRTRQVRTIATCSDIVTYPTSYLVPPVTTYAI